MNPFLKRTRKDFYKFYNSDSKIYCAFCGLAPALNANNGKIYYQCFGCNNRTENHSSVENALKDWEGRNSIIIKGIAEVYLKHELPKEPGLYIRMNALSQLSVRFYSRNWINRIKDRAEDLEKKNKYGRIRLLSNEQFGNENIEPIESNRLQRLEQIKKISEKLLKSRKTTDDDVSELNSLFIALKEF